MRTILICTDFADGRTWAVDNHIRLRDLILLSPRSPHRTRGVKAGAIYATPAARSHERYDELLAIATPCLATLPFDDRVA